MNTFFPTNNERVTIDATMDFFPQRPPVSPKIYAYELIGVASHRATSRSATPSGMWIPASGSRPTPWQCLPVLETWPAMRSDGSCFTDKDLHAVLRRKGFGS
mgnify:CR=1 FL=1